jgi:hypothetical protein
MSDEIPVPSAHARAHSPAEYPPPPELGDVIDALDDAAASLKVVVRNQTDSLLGGMRRFVRDQPLMAMAIAGATAYLIGRLRR